MIQTASFNLGFEQHNWPSLNYTMASQRISYHEMRGKRGSQFVRN